MGQGTIYIECVQNYMNQPTGVVERKNDLRLSNKLMEPLPSGINTRLMHLAVGYIHITQGCRTQKIVLYLLLLTQAR